MNTDVVRRYEQGASLFELASESKVCTVTMRKFLVSKGVAIRSKGPPTSETKLPTLVPRYSCAHPKVKGHAQCPTCDRCQCTPGKRRRTGQKYGGLEACRCGRLIAE